MRMMTRRGAAGIGAAATVALAAALALQPTPAGAQAGPAPATEVQWTADLAAPDAVNVRHGDGLSIADVNGQRSTRSAGIATATVLTTPRQLDRPVADVRADLDATVPGGAAIAVEVRGQQAGGWTEWREATAGAKASLPAASTTVQARLTLTTATGGPSPVLRAVRMTASFAGAQAPARAASPVQAQAAPRTYRVFATREGLVGRETANGHIIRPRDHFVALPSRRGLSPRNSNQYSVRVCNPANNRCETAPVWDVGPWNTKDDYWNPPSQRQMWRDLPQGKPQAQAAHQDNYNNGRDEFGRDVPNPAGIDLADGTFWDGLGMTNNGWVNVTFLWTGTDTPAGTWPTVRQGATGETVRTVQHLLNHHGASLATDGNFGSGTAAAVQSFQTSKGLSPDGAVGPQTWAALIVTVQRGANNNAVKAVQSQLTAHGHATGVDGNFGSGTETAVKAFQSAAKLEADGIVGTQTWQALVG